jgi:hypothetical protein
MGEKSSETMNSGPFWTIRYNFYFTVHIILLSIYLAQKIQNIYFTSYLLYLCFFITYTVLCLAITSEELGKKFFASAGCLKRR